MTSPDDDGPTDREDPDPIDQDPNDDSTPTISCPHCGKEIFESSEFCHHCGKFISEEDKHTPHPLWYNIGIPSTTRPSLMWRWLPPPMSRRNRWTNSRKPFPASRPLLITKRC